jgi:general secretion pathway protein C
MLTPNDIETLFTRPVVAQGILALMVLVLGHELVVDVISYHSVRVAVPDNSSVALNHHIIRDQSMIKKNLRVPIFGDYIPKALLDLNVKASDLNMSIVGVLFSTNQKESQALISLANSPANTYVVGDKLTGNVTIKQITPDGVVLEHAGELESLSLPKDQLTFDPPPKPLVEE